MMRVWCGCSGWSRYPAVEGKHTCLRQLSQRYRESVRARGLSASTPWHKGSMRTGPLFAGGSNKRASGLLSWEKAAPVRSAIDGEMSKTGSNPENARSNPHALLTGK